MDHHLLPVHLFFLFSSQKKQQQHTSLFGCFLSPFFQVNCVCVCVCVWTINELQ